MAQTKPLVSLERLYALLRYEEETGNLYWRIDKARAKAGDQAGCSRSPAGYSIIKIDGKIYYNHRLIWFYMTGEWPKEIDHKNLNKQDNRFENLRLASRSENQANRLSVGSKSGYKGVIKRNNKYVARVKVRGRTIVVGSFGSPEAASLAYRKAGEAHFGAFFNGGSVGNG